MSNDLMIALLVIVGGFSFILWWLNRKLSVKDLSAQSTLIEWLKSTQNDLKNLQNHLTHTLVQSDKNVTDTLQKSYTELNHRLDSAAKVIGELKSETGKFTEIGRSMKSLQDFLNSPKLRGGIGEQILGDLLAQVLPSENFVLQYRFNSGEIVDAIIKTQAGIIPIDSKFPMENFTKMTSAENKKTEAIYKRLFTADVKKHIKTIADKYIQSSQQTVDFALMYIPSETMYYEIAAQTEEITAYAQSRRVLPVSPSTFYAFLRTILISFEGQRIATEAQNILRSLRGIHQDAGVFNERLIILQKHITNAYNNMNSISADFNRLQSKISDTQSLSSGMESKPIKDVTT